MHGDVVVDLDVDVVLEILHHAESPESVDAEDGLQLGIADGELLVLRIVQVALLDDCPHALDHLVAGHLSLAHDRGQLGRKTAVLGESSLLLGGGSSRHDCLFPWSRLQRIVRRDWQSRIQRIGRNSQEMEFTIRGTGQRDERTQ